MNNFTTVFLFTNNELTLVFGYACLGFGLIILLLGLAGILLGNFLPPIRRKGYLISLKSFESAFFSFIIWGGGLLWLGTSNFIHMQDEYLRLQAKYNAHQYQIAEGVVHVLHIQPKSGHDKGDIIKIGDIELEINAYLLTFGYKTTISHGGALTEGTYARVFYDYNPTASKPFQFTYTILQVDVKK